jgi:uncharacterized protein YijF (DUF1287 family)
MPPFLTMETAQTFHACALPRTLVVQSLDLSRLPLQITAFCHLPMTSSLQAAKKKYNAKDHPSCKAGRVVFSETILKRFKPIEPKSKSPSRLKPGKLIQFAIDSQQWDIVIIILQNRTLSLPLNIANIR